MNTGFKILLWPFSVLYGVITKARNLAYDWHVLRENRFDVHTIGVGNLAAGGSGKTPLVEYLLRILLREHFTVAVLSRGYKRKTRGFVLADENSSAEEIGDEPLIYKSKYKVQVAVDGIRVRGMKRIIAANPQHPDAVLLDDVFQHRALKCGLSIVVSDYNKLYFNDHLLPYGTLREFKSGIRRADVIVISKTPDKTSPVDIRNVLKDIKPKAHQRVFFSYLKYGELYSISDQDQKIDTLKELYRLRVISFAGIANAWPMINYLKEYASELRHLPFRDHYDYSPKDLEDILRYYKSFEGENKILVTTEKDLMRLKNKSVREIAERMNIYVLPMEVSFRDKEEEFNEMILKYVRATKIYHEKYT